ncbi:MAG: hypothetical protein IH860_02225 [Chloroflexi bacterium]|nr:hypothetical protein [Chloroflexota bacterium]
MSEEPEKHIHVESHGQTGGITAGVINVNMVLQPRISLSDQTHSKTNSGHQYEAILTVESQVLIPRLLLVARGRTVESIDGHFLGTGIFRTSKGKLNGDHGLELTNPEPGRYKITVVTREAETVRIDVM